MTVTETLFAASLILLSRWGQATDCPPEGKKGIWSRETTYLCSRAAQKDAFERDIRVKSPDGEKAVHVVKDHWLIEIGGRALQPSAAKSYVSYYPAELSWSPDSASFYITQSDATSEIDGFHTELYRLEGDAVVPMSAVSPFAQCEFVKRHQCEYYFQHDHKKREFRDEGFNIAGLKWLNGSDQILVVVEITPDSECGPRGYFGGYAVSTHDGQIVHRYSPQELHRQWGFVFGVRLRGDYNGLTSKERSEKP